MCTQSVYGERDRTLLSSPSLESPGGREKEDSGRKSGVGKREPLSHRAPLFLLSLSLLSDPSFAMGMGERILYVCCIDSSLWSDERSTGCGHTAWLRTLVLNRVDVHLSVHVCVSVHV